MDDPTEPEERDGGFTLVELMVTMLVTGIVLAMAGTFFANVARLTDWSGKSRDVTGQAALAMDEVRAVIRVAINNPTSNAVNDLSAVAEAKPASVTVYAYSNTSTDATTPTKVTLALEPDAADPQIGYLVESRITGTGPVNGYWSFNTAATKRRIAGPFLSAADTPFFRYYNSSSSTPITTGQYVSQGNRQDITYIEITTTSRARSVGGDDDPAVVTSRVGMPNLYRNVASNLTINPLPTPTRTVTPTTTPAASTAPTTAAPSTTTPTTTTPTTTTPTTTTPTTTTPSTTTPTTTTPTTTAPTTTAPTTTAPTTATPTPTRTRGIG